jgi:hypothetical protein
MEPPILVEVAVVLGLKALILAQAAQALSLFGMRYKGEI